MKTPRWRGLAVAAASALALAACSTSAPRSDGGPLEVMAAIYPLQYMTEQVGGEHVHVTPLTPPGVDAHELELSPNAVAQLTRADLVVYLSGFQAAVDDAVTQSDPAHVLDAADHANLLTPEEEVAGATAPTGASGDHAHESGAHAGHDHSGADPHFWLDPTRLADVGRALGEELATADPAHAADYRANADAFATRQGELDAAFTDGLATCATRTIVVAHQAYGYLAERYRLEQVAIAGLDPEGEPSPAHVAEVSEEIHAHGVNTIFAEPGAGSSVADTIAGDLGLDVAVLDPLDARIDQGVDYDNTMRANLAALKGALQCA
ncbi:metal ABC transporter substrate-binding protein [Georgenia sp. SYP-B2076]|uniref:metal ABC transporter substrate-binding protein n=1 Tax=Georgenia sp. SYP-B2076 TaxID=2495881 RepID=UPI000F8D06C8|nr:metal ABC transporter substrate-binding protein [Georgenia sp. SYP-B2076]